MKGRVLRAGRGRWGQDIQLALSTGWTFWWIIAHIIISMSSTAKVLKALIILHIDFLFYFTFGSSNPTYCLFIAFVSVCSIRFALREEKQTYFIFCRPQMFSLLQLFAYMALERNRGMNDVSLDWPLILILRLQPPSAPSCSLTTSNHSHTPLRIVLQEKQYERRSLAHQSKGPVIFSPTPCRRILHDSPHPEGICLWTLSLSELSPPNPLSLLWDTGSGRTERV